MNKNVALVVVGLAVEGPFDYSVSPSLKDSIAVGKRVRVMFNRQIRTGYVIGFLAKSRFPKLNPILAVLDLGAPALDENALKLAQKFSEETGCTLGEAIETSLPPFLRKPKEVLIPEHKSGQPFPEAIFESVLVHDLTRTKRWPFLIEEINRTVLSGRGVIFLLPEKNLVEFTVAKLKSAVRSPVYIWDHESTPKEEEQVWLNIRSGGACVVVGTRSAVFLPVASLGMVVVYEEENPAYKQEQSPHYHLSQAAGMVAEINKAKLFLVSSAPLAETWDLAVKKKIKKVTLEADRFCDVNLVDMANYNPGKTSILSFPLQNNIQKCLEGKGKVILIMNQRGFSSSTRCNQCGHVLKCRRCSTNMTYLFSKKILACRHCTFTMELPKICPNCNGSYLRSVGTGIEKLESEASRLYPFAKVARYDKESKGIPYGWDILIATQSVLRNEDQLPVDLIGVLKFDEELNRFDFRCAHRAFRLLVHLRQWAQHKLIIQTRMLDNYCIKALSKMDFDFFYNNELKIRKELGFPPARRMVSVGLRGLKEEDVLKQANGLFEQLIKNKTKDIEVMDPYPEMVSKLRDNYRWTIMLKGKSLKHLFTAVQKSIKGFRKKNVIITVDGNP